MFAELVAKEIVCEIFMEKSLYYQTIKTSQGTIAFLDTGGNKFPIIFIHGNSCSSRVFKEQIDKLRDQYRIIAVDLPGHGKSSYSEDPDRVYNIPGYAAIIHEVINFLNLHSYVMVGFSLGGNIALQCSQITKDHLAGIMLVSSAPMKYSQDALVAYPPCEGSRAASPEQLTEWQAEEYMAAGGFNVKDPSIYFMIEDAMNTDGKARAKMVASVLAGKGVDETEIVKNLTTPLAIIAGSEDTVINLDYIANLNYSNLWHKKMQLISHANHAIPLHQANELNLLIEAFVRECQRD